MHRSDDSRPELQQGWAAEPVTRWAIAAAVVLIAGGVALRFMRLGTVPGVHGDETWMRVQVVRLLAGEGIAWLTPTGNPLNPFSFVPLVAS